MTREEKEFMKESNEEFKINLEFEKFIEEQKRKLRNLIRF